MEPVDVDSLKELIKDGISREALESLDRLFPERTPEVSDSLDQIRHYGGQRSVIRFLLTLCEYKPHGTEIP